MKKKCDRYEYAFESGKSSKQKGSTIGTNPYDPESETPCYEAWLDGWGSIHNDIGC